LQYGQAMCTVADRAELPAGFRPQPLTTQAGGNLLRHHRENQELPLSRQGEQHPAYASEHENLRGPGYYH
ncbi:hypothetical protein, partial [Escherichia coli]